MEGSFEPGKIAMWTDRHPIWCISFCVAQNLNETDVAFRIFRNADPSESQNSLQDSLISLQNMDLWHCGGFPTKAGEEEVCGKCIYPTGDSMYRSDVQVTRR